MKYIFLSLIVLFIVIGIVIVYNAFDKSEVHISTDSSAFVSVAPGDQKIEEIDGELYLLAGITPAPFPEEADDIYRHAKKKGKTIWITMKNSSPEIKFKMVGGLSKKGYMRIKCNSLEEAKALAAQLGL